MGQKTFKRATKETLQSNEELLKQNEEYKKLEEMFENQAQSSLQIIEAYNSTFDDIPEFYKEFKPAPGYVLVKLKFDEMPQLVATQIEKETNQPKTQVMAWYSQMDSGRAIGKMIAGMEYGLNVIVAPNAFFNQNGVISRENFFKTPVHTLDGFFLIPRSYVLGTY